MIFEARKQSFTLFVFYGQELIELKVPLAKILEPDGAMLGVDERNLYQFASARVSDEPTPEIVLPVLEWFQVRSYSQDAQAKGLDMRISVNVRIMELSNYDNAMAL